MTFDREPDLDNANVGTPEREFKEYRSNFRSYQIGSSFFVAIFGGEQSGQD